MAIKTDRPSLSLTAKNTAKNSVYYTMECGTLFPDYLHKHAKSKVIAQKINLEGP